MTGSGESEADADGRSGSHSTESKGSSPAVLETLVAPNAPAIEAMAASVLSFVD